MVDTQDVRLTKLDPNQAIFSEYRPIAPPARYDAIVFDTPLSEIARLLRVDVDGTVTLRKLDETTVTMNFTGGIWHAVIYKEVLSAGTSVGSAWFGS